MRIYIELTFTNHPNDPDKFNFGLQEKSSVEELARIYNIPVDTLSSGDVFLHLPTKDKQSKLSVKSQELKNLFLKYESKVICISNPDAGSLRIPPAQILEVP